MLRIYLCAFIDRFYLEEAKICIRSLRENGKFTGHIYVFTDLDCTIEGVTVIKTPCTSIALSASFRTRLFEYVEDFAAHDIFLYLDTDVIVLKPLPTFESIDNKIHVYGYPTRRQREVSFAGFLTDDPKYITKTAISSGILLFRPSDAVRRVFDQTYEMYMSLIKRKKINLCWEQPALCYVLIQEDMMAMTLNDMVFEERTRTKGNTINETHVFNHFCGMRGKERHVRMRQYLETRDVLAITQGK